MVFFLEFVSSRIKEVILLYRSMGMNDMYICHHSLSVVVVYYANTLLQALGSILHPIYGDTVRKEPTSC